MSSASALEAPCPRKPHQSQVNQSLEAGSKATGPNPDPRVQKGPWGDTEPCGPDRKPSCKNQDRGEKPGSETGEVDPFKEVKRFVQKKFL